MSFVKDLQKQFALEVSAKKPNIDLSSLGLSSSTIRGMRNWILHGKFGGNFGKFWIDVSKKLPSKYRSPSEPILYRGFSVSIAKAIPLLQGKIQLTKSKDVESWTVLQQTAIIYAIPDDEDGVGIVVKSPTAMHNSLIYISKEFLEAIEDKSDYEGDLYQGEVITVGGYKIKQKDVHLITFYYRNLDKIIKLFSLKSPPKNFLDELVGLSFENGKPVSWVNLVENKDGDTIISKKKLPVKSKSG